MWDRGHNDKVFHETAVMLLGNNRLKLSRFGRGRSFLRLLSSGWERCTGHALYFVEGKSESITTSEAQSQLQVKPYTFFPLKSPINTKRILLERRDGGPQERLVSCNNETNKTPVVAKDSLFSQLVTLVGNWSPGVPEVHFDNNACSF